MPKTKKQQKPVVAFTYCDVTYLVDEITCPKCGEVGGCDHGHMQPEHMAKIQEHECEACGHKVRYRFHLTVEVVE